MTKTKKIILGSMISLFTLGAVANSAMAGERGHCDHHGKKGGMEKGHHSKGHGGHGKGHGMRHGGGHGKSHGGHHGKGKHSMRGGKGKGGKMGGRMMKRMVKKLDLTDEQKKNLEALKTVMKEQREAMKAARKEGGPRKGFMSMLSEPKMDQEKAMEMVKKRAEMMQANAAKRIAALAAFSDSLTDEQRAKIKEMMEKKGKRGGKRGMKKHGEGKGKKEAKQEAKKDDTKQEAKEETKQEDKKDEPKAE